MKKFASASKLADAMHAASQEGTSGKSQVEEYYLAIREAAHRAREGISTTAQRCQCRHRIRFDNFGLHAYSHYSKDGMTQVCRCGCKEAKPYKRE